MHIPCIYLCLHPCLHALAHTGEELPEQSQEELERVAQNLGFTVTQLQSYAKMVCLVGDGFLAGSTGISCGRVLGAAG